MAGLKKNLFSLKNKATVVTGASGLLGKQHCEAIAAFGGDLILLDINKRLLVSLVKKLSNKYNFHFPNKGPFIAIVLLAIPLYDTFRVFFIRILSGYHPLHPDRNHIHHALLGLGLGHKKSTLILYVFSFLIAGFSYFMIDMGLGLSIFILSVIILSCIAVPFILLQIKNKKK